jgi:signal-transduction protein with cAMP-binding, CBS, and nucleotidyltransferase domain
MSGEIIIKEVMKTNILSVDPNITVYEAANLMKNKNIGNVVVLNDRQPIGILTESDILKKIVAEGLNPNKIKVNKVMSTPLVIINAYKTLEEAMKTMCKCNIRRLPVCEKGQIIGIITQRDISRLSPILHEISREWTNIKLRDEAYFKNQIFSGKCEDCGILSANLRNINGRILCEDCIDALKYEE